MAIIKINSKFNKSIKMVQISLNNNNKYHKMKWFKINKVKITRICNKKFRDK